MPDLQQRYGKKHIYFTDEMHLTMNGQLGHEPPVNVDGVDKAEDRFVK